MDLTEFSDNQVISDYIYQNKESIPIINVVKVTPEIVGRLDILIFEYCDGLMEYLPILMDFNKISNPFTIPEGTLINIPDYQYVLQSITTLNLDEKIPGVSNSMSCIQQNQSNKEDGLNLAANTTTGIPKLSVTLEKVKYDSETGIITY